MPNKSISLSGEVHISTEQVYTTVDALEALKAIGLAYGLYSRAACPPDRWRGTYCPGGAGGFQLSRESLLGDGSDFDRGPGRDPAVHGLSGCAAYHSAAGSGGTAARETADRRQRPWASTQARRKIP